MKKVTLSFPDSLGIEKAEKYLSALSGVVAVDIAGNTAVAHCGDRMEKGALLSAVNKAGMSATIVSETADQ